MKFVLRAESWIGTGNELRVTKTDEWQSTVLSTTRFPEAASSRRLSPYDRIFTSQDFAEFFAELCALYAPMAPVSPFYSVENITTPAFTTRLLTEGL
ncbi:MAG TPA: hypothetical protein VGI45_02560 [Terracidiphilus sp.]|jgi:hypothetical protein